MPHKTRPEILYIAPHSQQRSSVANYAMNFMDQLKDNKRFMLTPLLSPRAPEFLDGADDAVSVVRKTTQRSLEQCGEVANQVLHVELGLTTAREFWAAYHASRVRAEKQIKRFRKPTEIIPECPMLIVFHDPPRLPALPRPPLPPEPKSAFKSLMDGTWLNRMIMAKTNQVSTGAQKRMAAMLLERASVLASLSHRGCDVLAQRYPEYRHKIAWIPPMPVGVIPDDGEPNLRHGAGEQVVITFFGFLRPNKGVEFLIRALSALNRVYPLAGKAIVKIRGRMPRHVLDAGYKDNIQKAIINAKLSRFVRFIPGAIPEEEVNSLLRETDILILPYKQGACEGGSMTLLRAETWGIAPIASDTGCLNELIEDGKDGLLFPVGNITALAEAMEKLIANEELRMTIAQNRRTRALNNRSPAQVAALLLKLYHEMLQARDERRPVRIPECMQVAGLVPEIQEQTEKINTKQTPTPETTQNEFQTEPEMADRLEEMEADDSPAGANHA